MSVVYPLPAGDIIETYRGKAWVVICGKQAIGPFVGERSVAITWLMRHAPMGQPEEDGIPRERCKDGLLWLAHQVLPLEDWS